MEGDDPASRAADPPAYAALLGAARRGDSRAFTVLYARHAPMVHALALSTLDSHAAEDVVQEVFVQAWRKLVELRQDERFPAWLAAIARNRARSARRSARRRSRDRASEAELASLADARAGAAGEGGLESEELLDRLRELPQAYRETIALRYVEGLSAEEIARATALTPGSVRVNLCRGLKLLRERWSGEARR